MKILNSSEEFILQFGGTDYTIPNGEFEVTNEALANHILFVSNKWGKDVKDIGTSNTGIIKPKKEAIVKTKVAEVKKEEVVEAKEEAKEVIEPVVAPKKQGRPKKDATQTA